MTQIYADPAFYRTRVGKLSVIALHDGVVERDQPPGFIRGVPDDAVGLALQQAGMAPGKLTLTFTVLAIDSAGELTLIDAGFGQNGPPTAGRMTANLIAAGYRAAQVSNILISHFHGDHVSGLITRDGTPAFADARVLVPQPEWAYWMDDAAMAAAPEGLQPAFTLARKVFGILADRVIPFAWGDEPVPGIRAIGLGGHTPGMTGFAIDSEGERLVFVADLSNNPCVFARHPDWQASFDIDGSRAAETRRREFAGHARAHTRLAFYHAPFPGIGTLAPMGDAYTWCPEPWGARP
jgi:glyoxylase-like metal-dependent hydrolase (beta-lactamase superfamily II)